MPAGNRPCVFDPTTNHIVDFLRPGESEVEALLRLGEHGLDLVVLPLEKAWQRHKNAAKRPPVEITEGRFSDKAPQTKQSAGQEWCDSRSKASRHRRHARSGWPLLRLLEGVSRLVR